MLNLILKLPTQGPQWGVAYPYGFVKDAQGKGVGYTYITFEDGSGNKGIYPTDAQGRYDTRVPLGGAPWPRAYVAVDLYGFTYKFGPIDLSKKMKDGTSGEYNVILRDVYVPSAGVALVGHVKLESFSAETNTKEGMTYIKFKLVAFRNTDVHIIVTGVVEGQVSVVASSELPNGKIDITTWEGMPCYKVSFRLKAGDEREIVVYGKTGSFKGPTFYAIGYLASLLGADVHAAVSDTVKTAGTAYVLIVPFVVSALPLMHVIITASIARAIASVISEGAKNLLVRMW
jgi:hypothetical protein